MISSISNVSVQNMAPVKQSAQPNSKANEEATESSAERAQEARCNNPSIGRLIDTHA